MNKLFKIFEWYDVNNGIGEGKTQTYLMAEDKTKALEKFGKEVGDKMPWYGYGAKETTMKAFDEEIQEIYLTYSEIKALHDNLVEIYEDLEEKA